MHPGLGRLLSGFVWVFLCSAGGPTQLTRTSGVSKTSTVRFRGVALALLLGEAERHAWCDKCVTQIETRAKI